jgi:hypothetical protein
LPFTRERFLRYVVIGFVGVLLILAAVILENVSGTAPSESVWHKSFTWVSLLNELGFAFVISLIIIFGIEQGSRDEFNSTINARMDDIQNSVFQSTFKRNIPKELIDEVENLVLRADFIRSNHRSTYRMRRLTPEEVNNNDGVPRVLIADITTVYNVRNVSGIRKDFTVRLELEKSPVLEYENFVKIEDVSVNGVSLTDVERNTGDDIAPDTTYFKNFEHVIKNLDAGSEASVFLRYTSVKNLNDMEMWRSLLPSDGMTMSVQLPQGTGAFGIHAWHRADLIRNIHDDHNAYYEYTLDQAVLPHQGIVFWWSA